MSTLGSGMVFWSGTRRPISHIRHYDNPPHVPASGLDGIWFPVAVAAATTPKSPQSEIRCLWISPFALKPQTKSVPNRARKSVLARTCRNTPKDWSGIGQQRSKICRAGRVARGSDPRQSAAAQDPQDGHASQPRSTRQSRADRQPNPTCPEPGSPLDGHQQPQLRSALQC